MELPENIDASLWFTTEPGGIRYYLYKFGAHTFAGRLYAYDPTQHQSFCVSKSEIAEMSRESEYFIAGFLAGNAPGPPVGARGPLPDDDPRIKEWLEKSDEFYRSGKWPL